jgi:hypothetical protein
MPERLYLVKLEMKGSKMQNRKKAVMFFTVVLSLMFANGAAEAVTVTVDASVEHQEFEAGVHPSAGGETSSATIPGNRAIPS